MINAAKNFDILVTQFEHSI